MRYEYKVSFVSFEDLVQARVKLNALGYDGWHIVATSRPNGSELLGLIWERPLPDAADDHNAKAIRKATKAGVHSD